MGDTCQTGAHTSFLEKEALRPGKEPSNRERELKSQARSRLGSPAFFLCREFQEFGCAFREFIGPRSKLRRLSK